MKKKSLTKKLALNKETISSLNYDEMKKVKGASILGPCSESCSILGPCCDPFSFRTCPPPPEKVAEIG